MATVTHFHLMKGVCYTATVTTRSDRLSEDEGTTDPEEEGCTHTPLIKPRIRVTTPEPAGLASYTTSWAPTTGPVEKVFIYLGMTSCM